MLSFGKIYKIEDKSFKAGLKHRFNSIPDTNINGSKLLSFIIHMVRNYLYHPNLNVYTNCDQSLIFPFLINTVLQYCTFSGNHRVASLLLADKKISVWSVDFTFNKKLLQLYHLYHQFGFLKQTRFG